MAFTSFKSIDELLSRYDITYQRVPFVEPVAGAVLSESVRLDIEFVAREFAFHRSEIAVREALLFPIIKDVWRHYRESLTLLSGEPFEADDTLRGELDYMVCKRSPHGPLVPDRPLLVVGEAKRDDRTGGWNQALGGMIAAQMVDATPGRTYYGLATTGRTWTFGKLEGHLFTEDPRPFGLQNLDELAGALHWAFTACRDQLRLPTPAEAR